MLLYEFLNGPQIYSEEPQGYFTHNGRDYDLNALLVITRDRPVEEFAVRDLAWILRWDDPDPQRVATADPDTPVLVTADDQKLVVLDGLHRLARAVQDRRPTIPGRYVLPQELAIVEIRQDCQPCSRKGPYDTPDFL